MKKFVQRLAANIVDDRSPTLGRQFVPNVGSVGDEVLPRGEGVENDDGVARNKVGIEQQDNCSGPMFTALPIILVAGIGPPKSFLGICFGCNLRFCFLNNSNSSA